MSLNRYPGLDHFCTLACWPISPRHGKKLKRNRQENVIYKLSHRMYPTYSGHIELLLTILARLLNIIGQRESTFKTEVESEVGNAKCLNFSILSTFVFKRQSISHLHTWTISTTAPSPPHPRILPHLHPHSNQHLPYLFRFKVYTTPIFFK